jgi:FtsZ-binding cell division protein ZapB
MNLVRESNAHLRRENEELTSRLGALDKQLKQLKDAAAPFEEEARTVKADKEALEAANVQLLTDAHYWRDRYVLCVAESILSRLLFFISISIINSIPCVPLKV